MKVVFILLLVVYYVSAAKQCQNLGVVDGPCTDKKGNKVGLALKAGPRGARGPTGPAGPVGPNGKPGQKGTRGPAGRVSAVDLKKLVALENKYKTLDQQIKSMEVDDSHHIPIHKIDEDFQRVKKACVANKG